MWQILASAIVLANSGTLTVQSSAFANKNYIPSKFTCEGLNFNPSIAIGDIPANTKSLALIVEDIDSPNGPFDHWVMWNIPVTGKINENSAPGIQGKNSRLQNKYTGPCPPNGIHEYHFKVYALDNKIDLPSDSGKAALLKAMEGHIVASGELIGLYKK